MPTVVDYLKYANLQMAAESFVVDGHGNPLAGQLYLDALLIGNKHATKFTKDQADAFVAQWEVVAQKPNTETGFSGTLFKANKDDLTNGIKKDDLVLSFRSTEFIDDNLNQSDQRGQGRNFSVVIVFALMPHRQEGDDFVGLDLVKGNATARAEGDDEFPKKGTVRIVRRRPAFFSSRPTTASALT